MGTRKRVPLALVPLPIVDCPFPLPRFPLFRFPDGLFPFPDGPFPLPFPFARFSAILPKVQLLSPPVATERFPAPFLIP
jgi:hypothetical protein